MNNRFKIAEEFAKSINSDDIIQIILFGSVARGDDDEDSDIDILIITNHEDKIHSKVAKEVATIILDKEELISPHIMTEEHFNKIKPYSFISNVMKDGVILG